MTVSRDVILDLLPLYLSGEASADSMALVQKHLDADSELAGLAEKWEHSLANSPPEPVNPDAQALAYGEAKRQMVNRMITLAAVVAIGTLIIGGAALAGAMFLLAR
jgi:anti-sigma factor RsiW